MDGMYRQQPDGSYAPAEPMAYVPGIDWEVGTVWRGQAGARRRYFEATAYDGPDEIAATSARTMPALRVKMLVAHLMLRLRGHKPLPRRPFAT